MSRKAVGKFSSIIGLNAFDCTREGFHQMFYKLSGRIGAVLLKCLYEMPAKIFVNSRILEKLFSNDLGIFQTGRRNKFHINLDALPGIIHLFIRLWDVLWIWRLYRHDPLLSEKTVKSGNRTGIAVLTEFYPENDQTSMGIFAAHITDQLDFIVRVLIRMVLRSA